MRKFNATINYLGGLTPVFLMSALSLLSIVLVKQSVVPNVSENVKPILREHNYYLKKFFTSQFTGQGDIRAYLGGQSALHFEQPQQLAVEKLSFYYTGAKAKYQGNSNSALIDDNGDTVKLFNQAQLLRTQVQPIVSTTRLQSEHLEFNQNLDTFSSNKAVKLNKGNSSIAAESLNYNNKDHHLELKGRVKIKIEAKNN